MFLRLAAISVGSVVFAMAVPAVGDPTCVSLLLPLSIFVAVVFGLLILEASSRRAKLMESVRVELNKLRRIYHLSKNIAENNPKYRGWFTDMHGFIYGYLSGFSGKDFDLYDSFNASFRKVSYHIYTIPDMDTRKSELLFQELLRTAGLVAEMRQQIKELWDSRMTAYGWTVVGLLSLGYAVAVAFAMDDCFSSRVIGGISLAAMLLAVDFLHEADTRTGEKKALAERYVANVARLELGRRHEDE